jgi:hypothetical protein
MTFSDKQRAWESQLEAAHERTLNEQSAYDDALETETCLQLAALRAMTGAELMDNYVSLDQTLEALASDLAAAILATAPDFDPPDDFGPDDYDRDCSYWERLP